MFSIDGGVSADAADATAIWRTQTLRSVKSLIVLLYKRMSLFSPIVAL
jgi:hypothetical protein